MIIIFIGSPRLAVSCMASKACACAHHLPRWSQQPRETTNTLLFITVLVNHPSFASRRTRHKFSILPEPDLLKL